MKAPLNEQMRKGLAVATGLVFMLDALGITVHSVDVDGGRPVVQVDRFPDDVTPGHLIYRPVGNHTCTLRTASWRGCRLHCESAVPMRARA